MKGVYLLVFSIPKNMTVQVGSLGILHFKKGMYTYVGSAQNSLEQRILRHLRKEKKRFWHIDYLLCEKTIKISKVLLKTGRKNLECLMGKKICERGKAIPNFGSSDCKCTSHLFKIVDTHFIRDILSMEKTRKNEKIL